MKFEPESHKYLGVVFIMLMIAVFFVSYGIYKSSVDVHVEGVLIEKYYSASNTPMFVVNQDDSIKRYVVDLETYYSYEVNDNVEFNTTISMISWFILFGVVMLILSFIAYGSVCKYDNRIWEEKSGQRNS